MSPEVETVINLVFRWGHIIFGIIWIGHLTFLNLVNVPFQGDLEGELKPRVNPKLLLRAFYWFRMGAMWTFVFGWLLFGFKYFHQKLFFESPGVVSNRGWWMLFGVTLGTVMWFNVWFIIWPRQKAILEGLAAGKPHPDAATMAKLALKVSRLNLFLSGPMLAGMIIPNNAPFLPLWAIVVVTVIGVGFWMGPIKRSFKVKTTA